MHTRFIPTVALAVLAILILSHAPDDGARAQFAAVHDIEVTSVETFGPAAVNISDTNGRYIWVVGYYANNSDHTEMVNADLSIPEDVPPGCEREIALIVPGQASRLIEPGDEKYMIWRVRYECHAPATFAVVRQTMTVGVTHCDPSTSLPGPITSPTPGGPCPKNTQPPGSEPDISNNVGTAQSGVLVR